MRPLLVAAVLAAPHLAAADDLAELRGAVRRDAAFAALIADQVQVELPIDTAACGKLTGTVARDKLVPCLRALGGTPGLFVNEGIGSTAPILTGVENVSVAVTFRAGKITAIGPVAPSGADAKLATTVGQLFVNFAPSKAVAAAIDKRNETVTSIHKVCFDARGAITSRRVIAKSKNAAFDKETAAWVADLKPLARPLKPFGTAIAFCDLVTVFYPQGEEGGVEGGVVGGEVGVLGTPPPPPPPPPPARPQNIPPTLLEPLRIAGTKNIAPDDPTKVEMARLGKEKVIASFKLCVDDAGTVAQVVLLKSSGFPAYDKKLHDGIATWAYKPYVVNDHPVPVCTAVTFIYSQAPPPPPPP